MYTQKKRLEPSPSSMYCSHVPAWKSPSMLTPYNNRSCFDCDNCQSSEASTARAVFSLNGLLFQTPSKLIISYTVCRIRRAHNDAFWLIMRGAGSVWGLLYVFLVMSSTAITCIKAVSVVPYSLQATECHYTLLSSLELVSKGAFESKLADIIVHMAVPGILHWSTCGYEGAADWTSCRCPVLWLCSGPCSGPSHALHALCAPFRSTSTRLSAARACNVAIPEYTH